MCYTFLLPDFKNSICTIYDTSDSSIIRPLCFIFTGETQIVSLSKVSFFNSTSRNNVKVTHTLDTSPIKKNNLIVCFRGYYGKI